MRFTLVLILALAAVGCSSPTSGSPSAGGTAGTAHALAVSLDLTDAYAPGTILAGTGDDRTDAHGTAAHMAVNLWIEDNSGTYVRTLQYFLATETSHNTMAGTYTGAGGVSVYQHQGVNLGDSTKGLARTWLAAASSHAGTDGTAGATIYVDSAKTPNGHSASPSWDFKDFQGTTVPNGTYHVKVLVLRHSAVQYGAVLHSFPFTVGATSNTTSTEDPGYPIAYDATATVSTTAATGNSTLDKTDSNFSVTYTP
jgi:hypothetical protein